MFVQTTQSTKSGKTYLTYLVRESFRTPAGPRARTVCNITALPEATRAAISQTLKGCELAAMDALGLEEAAGFGGLAVLDSAWRKFALGHSLTLFATSAQAAILKAVVFERLLFVDSPEAGDAADRAYVGSVCGATATGEENAAAARRFCGAMEESDWLRIEAQLSMTRIPRAIMVVAGPKAAFAELRGTSAQSARPAKARGRQLLIAVAVDQAGSPLRLRILAPDEQTRVDLTALGNSLLPADAAGPLVVLEENLANRISSLTPGRARFLAKLAPDALDKLRRLINPDVLSAALKKKRATQITIEGKRYLLVTSDRDLPSGGEVMSLFQTNVPSTRLSMEEVIPRGDDFSAINELFAPMENSRQRLAAPFNLMDFIGETRLRFLQYWLAVQIREEWRACGVTAPVVDTLRTLQSIRICTLTVNGRPARQLITRIPDHLGEMIDQLKMRSLFANPTVNKAPEKTPAE